MIIESQRAEISTATIEIRTLVIDRRQVTMATFRQVPKVPSALPSDDLWGTVNYWPEKDEGLGRRHVLLVRDGQLCRCVLSPVGVVPFPPHVDDADATWLAHCYLALPREQRPTDVVLDHAGWRFHLSLPRQHRFRLMLEAADNDHMYHVYERDLLAQTVHDDRGEDFLDYVTDHVAQWKLNRDAWVRSESLSQLYIAT